MRVSIIALALVAAATTHFVTPAHAQVSQCSSREDDHPNTPSGGIEASPNGPGHHPLPLAPAPQEGMAGGVEGGRGGHGTCAARAVHWFFQIDGRVLAIIFLGGALLRRPSGGKKRRLTPPPPPPNHHHPSTHPQIVELAEENKQGVHRALPNLNHMKSVKSVGSGKQQEALDALALEMEKPVAVLGDKDDRKKKLTERSAGKAAFAGKWKGRARVSCLCLDREQRKRRTLSYLHPPTPLTTHPPTHPPNRSGRWGKR